MNSRFRGGPVIDQGQFAKVEMTWGMASDGCVTITSVGEVAVPYTPSDSGPVRNTMAAETNLDSFLPPLREGFSRQQKLKLSEDNTRIEFTVIDKQLPFALPKVS